MRYLKTYTKLFESNIEDLENYVHDILLELEEDKGLQVNISRIRKDVEDDIQRKIIRIRQSKQSLDIKISSGLCGDLLDLTKVN